MFIFIVVVVVVVFVVVVIIIIIVKRFEVKPLLIMQVDTIV